MIHEAHASITEVNWKYFLLKQKKIFPCKLFGQSEHVIVAVLVFSIFRFFMWNIPGSWPAVIYPRCWGDQWWWVTTGWVPWSPGMRDSVQCTDDNCQVGAATSGFRLSLVCFYNCTRSVWGWCARLWWPICCWTRHRRLGHSLHSRVDQCVPTNLSSSAGPGLCCE